MICCDIPIDGLPSIVALAERQNHPHRGLHVHKGSPSAAKHEHRPSGVFRWPFGKKNRMRSGQQDVTVDEPLSVWYPSSVSPCCAASPACEGSALISLLLLTDADEPACEPPSQPPYRSRSTAADFCRT